MKSKKWIWIISSLLIVVVLVIAIQFWVSPLKSDAETLTKEEAQTLVEANYQGEVTDIQLKDDQYFIEMQKKNAFYVINVDANSGEILSISNTGNQKDMPNEDTELAIKEEQPPKTVDEPKSKVITENDATQIALKEVNGSVSDIDLETKGDISYYFVEIETADNREASVQINTITGETASITWDSDDDDDDDDE